MESPTIESITTDEVSSLPANDVEDLTTIQRDIQRKFGRALLLLQQYERLMKWLVAENDVSGPVGDLQRIKETQVKAVSKKTLGQVVGELTGRYITPALPLDDEPEESDADAAQPNVPWIRINFRMELTEADFKETERKLAELVGLRNDLVHHFLDSHDIWTQPGCRVANEYLDDCHTQIDVHFDELRQIVKHTLESREMMASFIRTPEFKDFFFHGIYPGGAGVSWPDCTIVKLLRDADAAHAKDGWTFLQDAIDHIRMLEPTHTPSRYGCSSWRHVLHESAQFDIRREQAVPGKPTLTWYRSR